MHKTGQLQLGNLRKIPIEKCEEGKKLKMEKWNSKLGSAGSALGAASSAIKGNSALSSSLNTGMHSAIQAIPGIGGIASAALGMFDTLGGAFGAKIDTLDAAAASRAGLGGADKASQILSGIPGISTIASIFAGKTAKSNKSAEINQLTSAYGGATADIDAAQDISGKKMLFGKGKANKFINEQNRINTLLTDIGLESKLKKSNSAAETFASQNQNTYSGYTPQLLLSKKGTKFPELDTARNVLKSFSTERSKTEDLQIFKDGGKLNVIAEGPLHARKNNLEEIAPELKGMITKKGIPVVSYSEGGDITQHAEIEGGELILNKDLSRKLETLMGDGSEDAMLKAGKLLATAIMRETEDNTNSII